jgi:hypothetical protein
MIFFTEWHNNQWFLPMWGKIPALNIDIVSKITTNYQHVLQYRVPFSKKKIFFAQRKKKLTKHKSFHKVDTNFGTKKKVEICLQSRCLLLLPYTVVTRGTKNMDALCPLCLTLFCQMNRDLEKTCCSSITWPFFM